MKRLALLLGGLAALACPSLVSAQICAGQGNIQPIAYANETLSVGGTATPFTSSVYAPAGKAPKMAQVTQTSADIRYDYVSGVTPTTSVGHLSALPSGVTAYSFLVCGQSNIQNFKSIAVSGTATLTVTYLQ